MTINYPALGACIGFVTGTVYLDVVREAGLINISPVAGYVITAVLVVGAALLWVYSPLPNTNGSFGADRDAGYWGWTRDSKECETEG
jgi:hypothetical protein